MAVRRIPGRRWVAPVLGTILFLSTLFVAVALTLPDDFLVSAVRSALGRYGMQVEARQARL